MDNGAISGHIRKALGNLESARVLFDNRMFDNAVSASYYSVFHAASALLASKGMEFSNHKTMISKYNEIFIRPGLIGGVSFRALTALFKLRLDYEYDPILFIGEDGAKEALRMAFAAVQDIKEYCGANNMVF